MRAHSSTSDTTATGSMRTSPSSTDADQVVDRSRVSRRHQGARRPTDRALPHRRADPELLLDPVRARTRCARTAGTTSPWPSTTIRRTTTTSTACCKAMKASLDYCSANFSPYQFRQLRIVEFPAYANFAQSFANTIPYSEAIGFILDTTDPDKIDMVTYVTAHEIAHQWWAHQVIGADMQGMTMLSETLAQYSALMVMEKMYGPEQIRRFLKFELDRYLRGRGGEMIEEVPLARVENQDVHPLPEGLARDVPAQGSDWRGGRQSRAAVPVARVRVQGRAVSALARPHRAAARRGGPGAPAADHRPVREDHAVRPQGHRARNRRSVPTANGTSRSTSMPASSTRTARVSRPRRRSTRRSMSASSRPSPARKSSRARACYRWVANVCTPASTP